MGAGLMLPVKGGFSYIVEFFPLFHLPFNTSSFESARLAAQGTCGPVAWHPLSPSIELPLGSASAKRAVRARMLFCLFATARLSTHVFISLPFHLPPDPLSTSTLFLFNKSLLPRFHSTAFPFTLEPPLSPTFHCSPVAPLDSLSILHSNLTVSRSNPLLFLSLLIPGSSLV